MKKVFPKICPFIGLLLMVSHLKGQPVMWDNEAAQQWPSGCRKVNVLSTFDSTRQAAIIWKASAKGRPLLVSLHTWSGNYLQEDSIVHDAIRYNWNYIHPDFRGPNNKTAACGSNAVIRDIEDAIRFGIDSLGADSTEVHILGVSGGGYAAMLCYMKLPFQAKSYSAWVGISDLEAWYYESLVRRQKYANDLMACIGDSSSTFNETAGYARSPMHLPVPQHNGKLLLYAGIHDGYTGSVPITHTLRFFNKIAGAAKPFDKLAIVPQETILQLTSERISRTPYPFHISGRRVHFFKETGNVSVTIFEGGHEMLVPVAFNLIPYAGKTFSRPLRVLAIGDSNGANEGGWVHGIRKELPWANVYNAARGGRTIGFDNYGDTTLNELRLLQTQLRQSVIEWGSSPDWIILALGTNDAKMIFDRQKKKVAENFEILAKTLNNFRQQEPYPVRVLVILPPPISTLADIEGKYKGAIKRLQTYREQFRKIASHYKFDILSTDTLFSGEEESCTYDGVHLTPLAQKKLLTAIIGHLRFE